MKDVLIEVIDRYLTRFHSTPLSLIKTKFGDKIEHFDELLRSFVVERLDADGEVSGTGCAPNGDECLPRMMAFHLVEDNRRMRQAFALADAFFGHARNFARTTGRTAFSTEELAEFTVEQHRRGLSSVWGQGRLDLVLAKDFPKYLLSMTRQGSARNEYGRPEPIHELTFSGEIASFEAIETEWHGVITTRKPVLPVITPSQQRPRASASRFYFMNEIVLRQLVERDYAELQRIKHIHATKSRFVLGGGVIEALLLDALMADATVAASTSAGRKENRPIEKWTLSSLLAASQEMGIIDQSAEFFARSVKEFRNLVHPGREWRSNFRVGKEEAEIAEKVLAIVIRDLEARA